MSCYQLIKTMTKFDEKPTKHRLSAERFLNVVVDAKKPCSLLNAQIKLLIANHVREFCYSFDYERYCMK